MNSTHSPLILEAFESVKPLISDQTKLALELFGQLTSLDKTQSQKIFVDLCSKQLGKKSITKSSSWLEIIKAISNQPRLQLIFMGGLATVIAILVLVGSFFTDSPMIIFMMFFPYYIGFMIFLAFGISIPLE